jgi:hypothetical protein
MPFIKFSGKLSKIKLATVEAPLHPDEHLDRESRVNIDHNGLLLTSLKRLY